MDLLPYLSDSLYFYEFEIDMMNTLKLCHVFVCTQSWQKLTLNISHTDEISKKNECRHFFYNIIVIFEFGGYLKVNFGDRKNNFRPKVFKS